MRIRVLITLLIALPMSARAAELRQPWRAEVAPPKPGLPSVTVELGYPGPYIPAVNSPVVLRATAAGVPFHGYIGFRFGVNGAHTIDTPVVSPASLRATESWSFQTFLSRRRTFGPPGHTRPPAAEFIVEWCDGSMQTIAEKSAGAPPWTTFDDSLRPLRIVAGDTAGASAFGRAAYAELPAALPDRAQWYAGFSHVLASLETWLDLPLPVREAIFGSGVSVVLYGLPRRGQQLTTLDATLLPVRFEAHAGSYDAPWPYRGARSMPVATPISWTPKPGVDFVGGTHCPYFARTNAAAWGADGELLSVTLPATQHSARIHLDWVVDDPQRRSLLTDAVPALAAIAAVLLSLAAWFFVRRRLAAAIVAALCVVATGTLVARNRLRKPSGSIVTTRRVLIAPSVVDTVLVRRVYGASPLPGEADDPAHGRMSLTGDSQTAPEVAEVRTSATTPAMGRFERSSDWDSVTRWRYRREIDASLDNSLNLARTRLLDFHDGPIFVLERRAEGSDFTIRAPLEKQTDGRVVSLFALPPRVQTGSEVVVMFGMDLADEPVEMSWSGGSMAVMPRKQRFDRPATYAIPDDVLRQVTAQGGIIRFDVPLRERFEPFYSLSLQVQEKKS